MFLFTQYITPLLTASTTDCLAVLPAEDVRVQQSHAEKHLLL